MPLSRSALVLFQAFCEAAAFGQAAQKKIKLKIKGEMCEFILEDDQKRKMTQTGR